MVVVLAVLVLVLVAVVETLELLQPRGEEVGEVCSSLAKEEQKIKRRMKATSEVSSCLG